MGIQSLWLFGYVDKDGKGQSAVTMFGAKETNRELQQPGEVLPQYGNHKTKQEEKNVTQWYEM